MQKFPRAVLTLAALALLLAACDAEAEQPAEGDAGTFETLLGWVPEAYANGIVLGDIEAWRELVGVEAPERVEDEEADLRALVEASAPYDVSAVQGVGFNAWYMGLIDSREAPGVSERTSQAFGFGMRDVTAFAVRSWLVTPFPWGVMAGEFDPDEIRAQLDACAECVPADVTDIQGTEVFAWGDRRGHGMELDAVHALPLFDQLGRGGTMAFFDDHVIRTNGLDEMEETLTGPVLGEDPEWRRLARLYDDAGTLYLHVITESIPREELLRLAEEQMGLDPAFLAEDGPLPRLDSYVALAVGGGYEDGAPYTLVALGFEDDAAATANVDAVRERLEAVPPETVFGSEPWGNVEVRDVRAEGRYVVVDVRGVAMAGMYLYGLHAILPGLPAPQS